MNTINAPEIFPILALWDFVQCPWHFPNTPDAPQLWMVIFTLYFHPRLEPWALASHSLLFCPNRSQLSGRDSDHPAWVWQEPTLCSLSPFTPCSDPNCWSRADLRGLDCPCKRQDTQAWTEARRQIRILISSFTLWLFSAAATQKGPVKNRAFSRQTCSHKHISPGNINRRQKNVLGLRFPFLTPCASTFSLSLFLSVSLRWLLFLFAMPCKNGPHAGHQMGMIWIQISAIYLLLACLRLKVPIWLSIPSVLLNLKWLWGIAT